MIRCDIGACPKVYHLACIGKDDCFHTDCHFDFFHVATKLTFLRILGALHSLSLPLIDSGTIFMLLQARRPSRAANGRARGIIVPTAASWRTPGASTARTRTAGCTSASS